MLAPLVGLPSRALCLSYMSSILNRQLSSIVPDREPWAAIVRATMYHPRAQNFLEVYAIVRARDWVLPINNKEEYMMVPIVDMLNYGQV